MSNPKGINQHTKLGQRTQNSLARNKMHRLGVVSSSDRSRLAKRIVDVRKQQRAVGSPIKGSASAIKIMSKWPK